METINNALRAVASGLQLPVSFILLLLLCIVVIMAGTLVAELFTERIHMKAQLPALLGKLEAAQQPLDEIIRNSQLLKRQKKVLLTVCAQTNLTPLKREALAEELLEQERAHYDLRVKITDLIMKLGPMFGLLGTLIPLGPGIIALGRGDTYTLSTSLLNAFDTTIAGLVAAAVATVISTIRRRWYTRYMGMLSAVMECLLEAMENAEA